MRKDVREFIRRLESVGLTVEPTPGHYTSFATGSRSGSRTGCAHAPVLSRHDSLAQAAILELRKVGSDV